MSELTHTDVLKYVGIFCFSIAVIGILLYFFVFKKKKPTPPTPPSICKQNSDCTTGYVCSTDGVCVTGNCNTEKPCKDPNQSCQNYNCMPIVKCKKNVDCNSGSVCSTDGVCVIGNCNSEKPCKDPTQFCQNYNCVPYSDTCTGNNGRKNKDGVCICNPYHSNAQPNVIGTVYKGKNCQYSDNDNCKGQGIVDDNGKCTWVAGKVFPRCHSLQNPSEQDYTKLLCDKTINPKLFSTSCIPNNGTNTLYGCPIFEDLYAWKPYIGLSCHYPYKDKHDCLGGATTRRFNGTAGSDSENNAYNLCQIDNLKNITNAVDGFDFSKVDTSGLQSTVVSTFPLVREDHAGGDKSWGASPQSYGNVSDNIKTDINNECWWPGDVFDRYQGIRVEPTFVFGNSYAPV